MRDRPGHEERRQLAGAFLSREAEEENEAVKAPQREAVADFLLSHHRADDLVLGTLPGIRWSFERLIQHLRPGGRDRFVGLERNYAVARASVAHMPGLRARPTARTVGPAGEFQGWVTGAASLTWALASTFMGLGRGVEGRRGGGARRRQWARDYKGWTAAWLDLQSPLGPESLTCLRRLEAHAGVGVREVPWALTILLGREDPETVAHMNLVAPGAGALERRGRLAEAVLEGGRWHRNVPGPRWTYRSAGGATMAILTGRLVLREA